MTITKAQVEAAAMAIRMAEVKRRKFSAPPWETLSDQHRDWYRQEARAALAAAFGVSSKSGEPT